VSLHNGECCDFRRAGCQHASAKPAFTCPCTRCRQFRAAHRTFGCRTAPCNRTGSRMAPCNHPGLPDGAPNRTGSRMAPCNHPGLPDGAPNRTGSRMAPCNHPGLPDGALQPNWQPNGALQPSWLAGWRPATELAAEWRPGDTSGSARRYLRGLRLWRYHVSKQPGCTCFCALKSHLSNVHDGYCLTDPNHSGASGHGGCGSSTLPRLARGQERNDLCAVRNNEVPITSGCGSSQRCSWRCGWTML